MFIKEGANVGKFDGHLALEEEAIDKYRNGFHPGFGYAVSARPITGLPLV